MPKLAARTLPKQTDVSTVSLAGAYAVHYEKQAGGYYVFRIKVGSLPSLDVQTLKNRMMNWLMTKTDKGVVGNRFPNHPGVEVDNKSGSDLFVLLTNLADVRTFEQRFQVVGFTPTMKV